MNDSGNIRPTDGLVKKLMQEIDRQATRIKLAQESARQMKRYIAELPVRN